MPSGGSRVQPAPRGDSQCGDVGREPALARGLPPHIVRLDFLEPAAFCCWVCFSGFGRYFSVTLSDKNLGLLLSQRDDIVSGWTGEQVLPDPESLGQRC